MTGEGLDDCVVVSVHGKQLDRVLIEMRLETAETIFDEPLAQPVADVIKAVESDIEKIREQDPDLADSTLAATAIALAREIVNPYNSATSKSMCAHQLRDTMADLRELAPPERKRDGIDDIAAARERRRRAAGGTAAEG